MNHTCGEQKLLWGKSTKRALPYFSLLNYRNYPQLIGSGSESNWVTQKNDKYFSQFEIFYQQVVTI